MVILCGVCGVMLFFVCGCWVVVMAPYSLVRGYQVLRPIMLRPSSVSSVVNVILNVLVIVVPILLFSLLLMVPL